MATSEKWHQDVTASIGGSENYGKGIWPNPWVEKQVEWRRRVEHSLLLDSITLKIRKIFEPRFITGIETCELMEALITMTGSKQILELGMCTGFGSLHMLRAIVGKEGARLTSIDARPALDRAFFSSEEIAPWFRFIEGWTPQAIPKEQFDFVFVDSDHSVEHTQKELAALLAVTHKGSMICFHDCPEWQTPSHPVAPPVREYLAQLIRSPDSMFTGMMLPSPHQLDCEEEYGKGYDSRCNPGLAVLIRK